MWQHVRYKPAGRDLRDAGALGDRAPTKGAAGSRESLTDLRRECVAGACDIAIDATRLHLPELCSASGEVSTSHPRAGTLHSKGRG